MENKQTIYIGGDHASYELREKIHKYLCNNGFVVIDEGSYNKEPANYARYGIKVAEQVRKNNNSIGIVVCGSGLGINIAANKVDGIKSTLLYSIRSAEYAKKNKSNVVALGSRFFSYKTVINYLNVFLNIDFVEEN